VRYVRHHGNRDKERDMVFVWRKVHFCFLYLALTLRKLKERKKWLYCSVQCLSPISETTLLCADALWRLLFLRPVRLVLTWRWVWRIGEIIVTGGTGVPREKPVPVLLFASKMSHRLVGNPTQASRGARPATNRLSHGTDVGNWKTWQWYWEIQLVLAYKQCGSWSQYLSVEPGGNVRRLCSP